jgi:hypothetical protein
MRDLWPSGSAGEQAAAQREGDSSHDLELDQPTRDGTFHMSVGCCVSAQDDLAASELLRGRDITQTV